MQYSPNVCYVASLGAQILWIWMVLLAAIKAPHIQAPIPVQIERSLLPCNKKGSQYGVGKVPEENFFRQRDICFQVDWSLFKYNTRISLIASSCVHLYVRWERETTTALAPGEKIPFRLAIESEWVCVFVCLLGSPYWCMSDVIWSKICWKTF